MGLIGNIVKIPNEDSVIIDIGSNDGVKTNDIFKVISKVEAIEGSNGKGEVGTITFLKGCIRVDTVCPKMSTCTHIENSNTFLDSCEFFEEDSSLELNDMVEKYTDFDLPF